MAGVFSRSWEITKLSFNVMKQDKELLLFPLLSFIFSILFIFAILFPSVILVLIRGLGVESFGFLEYVLIFVTYLGLAFITIFFNVCVVYTTKVRFEGGDSTFKQSLGFAFSRIHLIFVWGLVSATVGLVLRVIDHIAERLGGIGEIILYILNLILGMLWSIITIFVVPAMVYYNLGPLDAIHKSVQTLKKTWGESIVRYLGLGFAQFIFIFLGLILAVIFFVINSVLNLGGYGVLVIIAIVGLYFLMVILVFSILNTIFNTALFVYADTGKVPGGYDKEVMKNAFRRRRRFGFFRHKANI